MSPSNEPPEKKDWVDIFQYIILIILSAATIWLLALTYLKLEDVYASVTLLLNKL